MSNIALQLIAWGVFGLHLAVGLVARRRNGIFAIALVDLLLALAVLMYWMQRWVGYATQGIKWYWTDQLFPLYALCVCVVSALGLAGRFGAPWPHWTIFCLHTLVLLAGALFATLLKFGAGI